jgi:hypothetical protein
MFKAAKNGRRSWIRWPQLLAEEIQSGKGPDGQLGRVAGADRHAGPDPGQTGEQLLEVVLYL